MALVRTRGPLRAPCVLAALTALTLFSEMGLGLKPLVARTVASREAPQWNEKRMTNSSRPEPFGSEYLEEAFEEQGYYLERLFLQYGENGTLSYGGLQRLLGSLGLGEVSMLQISHQGLKYISPSSQNLHPHDESDIPSQHLESGSGRRTGSERDDEDPTDHAEAYHSPHGGNEGHNHPELPGAPHPQPGQRHPEGPSRVLDHPNKTHLHGNCLNVTQLLLNFGLGKASHITPSHFTFLCPALLYQIDSGFCLRHPEGEGLETGRSESLPIDQITCPYLGSKCPALGWASLALAVISLPSMLALALVPLVPPGHLQTLLCPMAALAMGTLCGDALLHLLPHARPGPHSESEQRDSVLKGAGVLAGLYLFFLIEATLGLQRHFKRKVRQDPPSAEGVGEPEAELVTLQGLTTIDTDPSSERLSVAEQGHGHSHHPPGQGNSGTGSLVWMVVMGDGIHNLTDGLAIGVAFSQGLAGGLSTTVAVFCHELPHELGDLALLLGAGWPVRRLLAFSGVSAALGFLGLLAGTVLGHHFATLSPWVLAFTAGVFLYVALVDMMPEMLRGDPGPMRPLTRFFLQNLGLLAGGVIMLCIALFEDRIAFNLGDA